MSLPPQLAPARVLVLGGYGLFGKRICVNLLQYRQLHVVIAGRDLAKAQAFAKTLEQTLDQSLEVKARTSAISLDAQSPDLTSQLRALNILVLIHCAGPFQGQDYAVARACIAAGIHYIDLADSREFVSHISSLDSFAKEHDCAVFSGASSVPGLSSAVLAMLWQSAGANAGQVEHIDIGISPGNRTERGLATVRAILSYCGQAIPGWHNGKAHRRWGWSGMRRQRYRDHAGKYDVRWLVDCDVPDLALLPNLYLNLMSMRFGAGLELKTLHFGLYALAVLRRWRLIPNLALIAKPIQRMSDWVIRLGTDTGWMHVHVQGRNSAGQIWRQHWQLQAQNGDGPNVPTAAAVAITLALVEQRLPWRGAKAALEVLPLSEYLAVLQGYAIRCGTELQSQLGDHNSNLNK